MNDTLIIHTDVPTTRRQTLHHVFDAKETLLFSAKEVTTCIAWCHDRGNVNVVLAGNDELIRIEIKDRVDVAAMAALPADEPINVVKLFERRR